MYRRPRAHRTDGQTTGDDRHPSGECRGGGTDGAIDALMLKLQRSWMSVRFSSARFCLTITNVDRKSVGGCWPPPNQDSSQIEEDAGEKPEVEPEDLLRDGHQERDRGTRDGSEDVGDEEGQRAPAVVPVQRRDGVGVEPVGEVVAEHGDRDDCPDRAAGLEPGTNGHAVQQAMHDQRGRGEDAEAWGVNVAAYSPSSPSCPRWIASERSTTCKVRKPSTRRA